MVFSLNCWGQVKHNYQVEPNATTCDSLNIFGMNLEESILEIENATFRFKQQFEISRVEGIRSARYFTCDGVLGYLIVIIGDNKYVFIDMPKFKWEEMIRAADINQYYEDEIEDLYACISANSDSENK